MRLEKLEQLRGFAAVYVMVGHGSHSIPIGIFGQDAVMVFFILSGFVIAYSTAKEKETLCFRNYLVKRFRRIYPMFLMALLLSAGAAFLTGADPLPSVWNLAGNLLLLQDVALVKPGTWFDFFQNPNLWSISYEWWFYMAFFPIWTKVTAERQRYVAFAISALGTMSYALLPNTLSLFCSYFILWWMGVELAREYLQTKSISWSRQRSAMSLTMVVAVLWVVQVIWIWQHGKLGTLGFYPLLPLRHFVSALSLMGVALFWRQLNFRGFSFLLGPFGRFSPSSYGIYIYHWPVMVLSEAFPSVPLLFRFPLYCGTVICLAWFIEVRLQPYFVKLSRPLIRRASSEGADIAAAA